MTLAMLEQSEAVVGPMIQRMVRDMTMEYWSRMVRGMEPSDNDEYAEVFRRLLNATEYDECHRLMSFVSAILLHEEVSRENVEMLLAPLLTLHKMDLPEGNAAEQGLRARERELIALCLVHPSCPTELLAVASRLKDPGIAMVARLNKNLPDDAAVEAALMDVWVDSAVVSKVLPHHPFPSTLYRQGD